MRARSFHATASTSPQAVTRALQDPANESPKAGEAAFAGATFRLIARPADAFRAAESEVRAAGFDCVLLGDSLQGEARDVAAAHARLALDIKASGRRAVILSGGELTVTLRGEGRGGPNQEYALALAAGARRRGRYRGPGGGHRRYRRRRAAVRDDPAGAYVDSTDHRRVLPPSASILPPFSPKTIRAAFLPTWAILWRPGRPSRTSMISVPSSLTRHDALSVIAPLAGMTWRRSWMIRPPMMGCPHFVT